ncbi:MAG: ABC transporter permease [Lachnospiraceae bacterium]|nr:ABC transporter permease [Lachnospiraceae bacterium]
MDIFKTYVKRNLKKNRLRTTMTIMGIILSVALVAAVIEGAFSGVEYIRDILKDAYGNHHGYAMNMTTDTSAEFIGKDELESFATFDTVGWAEIDSQNSSKPYLLVKEATEEIIDFLSVKITEGRFPETDNEIMLPAHLESNGNVQYKIGDTITLTLSERYLDKDYVNNNNTTDYDYYGDYNDYDNLGIEEKDSIIDGIIPETTRYVNQERLLTEKDGFEVLTKTYTVCGIMERLPYTIEQYMCPGYTAIVRSGADGISHIYNGTEIPSCCVFFRVKDPVDYNRFHDTFEREHKGVTIIKNRELVAMYGGLGSRSVTTVFTGFVMVLIGLILFGSISLVYNSFSISINERTKQIGILKSVGATKKQIRKTIFYEAFFDCIISIPLGIALGCFGIGITLFMLQEGFARFIGYFGGFTSDNIKISLVLNVPMILLAIAIVIISVLLSAAIPALRASKVSPIDLVRQNADIKASSKIKKSRILSRLFGAEGMLASKNYSRNKKRYRSTIVSLTVSIILFIAASSFCSYLNSATESEVYTGNVDLVYYYYDFSTYTASEFTEPEELASNNEVPISSSDYREIKEMLLSAKDVSNVIVTDNLFDYTLIDPDVEVKPETEEIIDGAYYPEAAYENSASLYFIDDESFSELLKSEGLTVPEGSDGAWNAVVFNKGTYYTYDENGNQRKIGYKFIENEDELPKKLEVKWYNQYGLEGISPIDQMVDANGEVYIAYMDNDLVYDYYNIMDSEEKWRLTELALYDEFRNYLESIGESSEGVAFIDWDYSVDYEEGSATISDEPQDVSKITDSGKTLSAEELDIIQKCIFKKQEDLGTKYDLNILGVTYNEDYALSTDAVILLPFSARPDELTNVQEAPEYYIYSNNSQNSEEAINNLLVERNMDTGGLYNVDNANTGRRMIGRIVSVFSYGFILLISLVAIANVFNTISTNVNLRRREFGMLKSMGLSNKGVSKILNIECLIYGSWSLIIGLPLSIPVTWGLYKITNRAFSVTFSIPWYSVLIAVAAVFIVVFVTMLYASGKIKKDNTLDAIRADNI